MIIILEDEMHNPLLIVIRFFYDNWYSLYFIINLRNIYLLRNTSLCWLITSPAFPSILNYVCNYDFHIRKYNLFEQEILVFS